MHTLLYNVKMLVNCERWIGKYVEGIPQDLILGSISYQQLLQGPRKSQSIEPASRLRIEQETSRKGSRNANHSTATLSVPVVATVTRPSLLPTQK